MGKLRPNTSVGTVAGKIGELVFVHCADGRVIVRKAPIKRKKFKPAELQNQSRFAQAAAYMTRLKANPEAYAAYKRAAKELRKRGCDLAVADFLSAPTILDVDFSKYSGKAEQTIGIQAVDNVGVQAITVTITDAAGLLLETGAAIAGEAAPNWVYITQAEVASGQLLVIHVTAADRAGNSVTKALFHPIPPNAAE